MKTSLIKTMAMASGLASIAVLSVVPAMAEGSFEYLAPAAIQSTTTRAEVRSEYLRAVKNGTMPLVSDRDEIRVVNSKSATSSANTLTRKDMRADTIEWLRLHRSDVQMGGQ